MLEITSRKNPQVQHLKKLGADKAYRDVTGEFLCDGLKLYEEAIEAQIEIPLLATSCREIAQKASGASQVILLPEDVLESISPQKSPQALLFACKKPEESPPEDPATVLVLDSLQDPGNVGTLLRSATAFGASLVVLTGNCADLYNPKTVRAAMGALFRQRVCQMTTEEIENYVNQKGLHFLAAVLGDVAVSAGNKLPKKVAFAIGNEGQGLRQEIIDICHGTIQIPMEPQAESLNAAVAGSILLWEAYRQKEE